jgi:hypothetical protein
MTLSKELDEIVNLIHLDMVQLMVRNKKCILIWFPTWCTTSRAILRSMHRQRVARNDPTFSPSRSQPEGASSMKLVDQRNIRENSLHNHYQ